MHQLIRARYGLVAALLACAFGCGSDPSAKVNATAPRGTGFLTKTVVVNGKERGYSMFIPFSYNPKQKYPTIVFLHGIGETGSDGKKCLTVGLAPSIANRASSFPFIVLFPQSSGDWTGKERADMVMAVLQKAKSEYSIDPDCVTLTGLSTGGEGTWIIGAAHPDQFSALVPMAGYADYDDIPKLTRIPIWCFHNSGDPFVWASGSKSMVEKINAAGGNAKYTSYGSFGHNCWDETYDKGELFDWARSQRRSIGAGNTPTAKPSR